MAAKETRARARSHTQGRETKKKRDGFCNIDNMFRAAEIPEQEPHKVLNFERATGNRMESRELAAVKIP